jgi:dihydrofolate synthase/folylpolyglutamate synthase
MSAPPSPISTYREALDWIYSFIDYERTGRFVRDREDNLARMRALLAALGDPQRAYGVTHIAGSKGKGSTAALLASILHAAGVRSGLYTQPDLHTFRERIRADGELIPEAEVVRLAPRLQAAVAALDPALGPLISYDIGTALAFLYFREARARHAVIEVGLGGRLDATNVVAPPSLMATAITSISYEHVEVLGHTLGAIAGEKVGIVKPGVPLVCAAQAEEAVAVIARIAAERGAPVLRVGPEGAADCTYTYAAGTATGSGQTFTIHAPEGAYCDLELSLLGEHQLENATAAVALAEQLRASGLPLVEAAIRRGLREARWPARLHVVARPPASPWIVVDSAHNADSFARLFAALRRHFAFERLILVLGLLADKDLPGIAAAIARAGVSAAMVSAADNPRAMPPERIAMALRAAAPALDVRVVPASRDAVAAALDLATRGDLVCISGSVYFAGEALRALATRPEIAPGTIEIAGVDH